MNAQRWIIRGIVYLVLYAVIVALLWRFLLDESVFEVIFG